jgi:hypothetical protein
MSHPRLKYLPLEKLSVPAPVDRTAYLQRLCTGKRVLDLGAMDETAYESKRGTSGWLHEALASVAAEVVGVDSSSKVPDAGLPTGPRSVIYRGDVFNVAALLQHRSISPQIVVAGELIEHLPNPLAFLQSLRAEPALRGCTVLLTTPNATALHNCLIALTTRESTHPDHLMVLSYKTLATLLCRAGFDDWQLIPYFSRFSEMKERASRLGRPLISGCEKMINLGERLFPLMSFGWIARVAL